MNLAYIPSPTFSKFEIGPFTIHMYAICILIGICVAVWILTHTLEAVRRHLRPDSRHHARHRALRVWWARASTTASPRRPTTSRPPATWSTSSRCGKAAWPSSAASPSAPWWRSCGAATSTIRSRLFADAIAPALPVAQAIGRLGNWFNQELYGWPTTLPWGLKLNDADAIGKSEICYSGAQCPDYRTTLFHPTFLYEMIWNLIGAALIV